MKNTEKGFGAVEVLIIVVLVGLLGVLGWLAYDRQKNKSSATINGTSKTQTSHSQPKVKDSLKIPDGWVKYENTQYGFSFYYPNQAKIIEREDINTTTGDLNYYSINVSMNNGDNPALNVYSKGNYSVQIQVYPNKKLSDFLNDFGYKDVKIASGNGINTAQRAVSSEEIQAPGYTNYFKEKGGLLLSVALIGDISSDLSQNFVSLISFK